MGEGLNRDYMDNKYGNNTVNPELCEQGCLKANCEGKTFVNLDDPASAPAITNPRQLCDDYCGTALKTDNKPNEIFKMCEKICQNLGNREQCFKDHGNDPANICQPIQSNNSEYGSRRDQVNLILKAFWFDALCTMYPKTAGCEDICSKVEGGAKTSRRCRDQGKIKADAAEEAAKQATFAAENQKIETCKTTLSIDCLDQLNRCRLSPEDNACKDVGGAAGTGWTAAKPAIEVKIKENIKSCLVDLKDPLCLEITKKCTDKESKTAPYEYCDREWGGNGYLMVARKMEMEAQAGTDVQKAMADALKAQAEIDAAKPPAATEQVAPKQESPAAPPAPAPTETAPQGPATTTGQ